MMEEVIVRRYVVRMKGGERREEGVWMEGRVGRWEEIRMEGGVEKDECEVGSCK